MLQGKVIKSTGSWYILNYGSGDQIMARIKGKFRLNGIPLTNPVAVGDNVQFELENSGDEDTGIIKAVMPRRNYVVRQSPRKKHQLHLLASNIDQAVLLVTIVQPQLKQGFIDRFLLMTEPHDIPVHIVFNKSDLYSADDLLIYDYLKEIYEDIGYSVHLISSIEPSENSIASIFDNKVSLVSGQSGVGKSTFINTLIPNLELRTESISNFSGKGQHTTTFAEMHMRNTNSSIIDTPGIKTLSFNNLEPMDVAHNFREFFVASAECRFHDCAHINEPACAVKNKIEIGEISEMRYQNYLQILREIEEQNYWERHRNL